MLFKRWSKKHQPVLDRSAIKLGTVLYPCPVCSSSEAMAVYSLSGPEGSGALHLKCERCDGRWTLERDSPENPYILRLLDATA